MQAQSRLVKQQYGVGMPAGRLGKKHDKERNEPLKPFRALIEFDLDAKLIFNDDFQVLLIDPYAQLVGFSLVFAWNPDLPDRLGQIDARRIELIGAVVQLIAVFLQRGLVGGSGSGALPKSDNWRAVKPSSFSRQLLP